MSSNSFAKAQRTLKRASSLVQRASFAAMGRAMSHAKTVLGKEIRSEYSIKARRARSAITAKRVKTSGSTQAEILVRGGNLLASEFSLRPKTDTTGGRRKAVRLGIRKGGVQRVDRGFVSRGVLLRRKGFSSYPIEPVFGPSVPGMAANEHVVDAVQSDFKETYERRLEHEISRLMNKG